MIRKAARGVVESQVGECVDAQMGEKPADEVSEVVALVHPVVEEERQALANQWDLVQVGVITEALEVECIHRAA